MHQLHVKRGSSTANVSRGKNVQKTGSPVKKGSDYACKKKGEMSCKQGERREFTCPYLPEEDRRFMSRVRLIECLEEEDYYNSQIKNSKFTYFFAN